MVNELLLGLLALWLVLVHGFFVAVESSMLAASPSRLEEMAVRSASGATAALATVRAPRRPLATSQVGITAFAVLLGWAVAPVIGAPVERVLDTWSVTARWSTPVALAIGVAVVAVLLVSIGEIVPRSLALAAPERTATLVLPVHRVLVLALKLPVAALDRIASVLASGLGTPAELRDGSHTTRDLAEMVGESIAGGALDDSERLLLSAALSFTAVHVSDVMAHREDLVTVPGTATVAAAEALVRRSGHSRVLVMGRDGDRVIGFLHAKDLIALGPEHQDEFLPPGLVRVGLQVGPDDGLDAVLLRMRGARRHVAVVLAGAEVVGLVTLEDILEAIVGQIGDESDAGRTRKEEGL